MKKIKIMISGLTLALFTFSCEEEQLDTTPLEDVVGVESVAGTTRPQSEFGLVNVEQQRMLATKPKKAAKATKKKD